MNQSWYLLTGSEENFKGTLCSRLPGRHLPRDLQNTCADHSTTFDTRVIADVGEAVSTSETSVNL
jgi:hypothetical protein